MSIQVDKEEDGAISGTKEDRLTLLLKIAEKKLDYKRERRPVVWYGMIAFIFLTMTILASIVIGILGDNTYFGGLATAIAVPSGIIFFIFFIGFFSFEWFISDVPKFFNGPQRIKYLIKLIEEIEDLKTKLQLLEEFEILQRSPQERYKDQLPQIISQFQHQANGYRRTHYTFQIFIILLSLLVTGLTSGLNGLLGISGITWIAPILSLSVSFLTALTTLFRFHDRGFNLQQTADSIELEITACHLRIFDYGGLSKEDALHKLADRVERMRDEQRKRQQQLEQASDINQATEK